MEGLTDGLETDCHVIVCYCVSVKYQLIDFVANLMRTSLFFMFLLSSVMNYIRYGDVNWIGTDSGGDT